jgi:hypothetical protein
MAQDVCVIVTTEERARLTAVVGDRSRPLKHVQRARIVLHSEERLAVLAVARRVGVSRPAVWRWQRRYAEEGVDGQLRDKTRPPGKAIHAILDNYATHKHPGVRARIARHPRWVFHFTPTPASRMNAAESFFPALTRRRLKRGTFRSIADLEEAINTYIRDHNDDPKPFVWTKPAKAIPAEVRRIPVPSD